MAHTPIPNVANFDVAHPSPAEKRMTTNSPRKSLPRPRTLVAQRPPPLHKYPYLLECFDPRGELLAATILLPASTLGPTDLDLSPPCPATSYPNKMSGTSCLDPEDNQDHPEDITSCLNNSSGHNPSSHLDLGSGRRRSVTPLSGTSGPNTTSSTSFLDPEYNQDHPEDITSLLNNSSVHAPSSCLDLGSFRRQVVTPLYGTSHPHTTSGIPCLNPPHTQSTTHSNLPT